MALSNPYEKYRQQSILTASPGDLTLMLYNGCIKFINQAKIMIEKKDIVKAHESNIRAQMIIEEFMQTLDLKYEIGKNMLTIYEYLHNRLIDANIGKDIAILDEVLGFVIELRDTWEQVLEKEGRHQKAVSTSKWI